MSSHRFSILASVGFEMAWACRICCCFWHTTGTAREVRTAERVADDGRSEAELLVARTTEERSMAVDRVEMVVRCRKERLMDPVEGAGEANG